MAHKLPNPFLAFLYRRGYRLREAAEASGIPIGTLSAVSAGNRKLSPEDRRVLAKVLDCQPDSIPAGRQK